MNDGLERRRPRVTTVQWLTVGALAIIFVVVLIAQYGSTGDSSSPAGPGSQPAGESPAPTTAARAVDMQKRPRNPTSSKPEQPWPTYSLATVLKFDPFAAPSGIATSGGVLQPDGTASAASQKSKDDEAKRRERQRILEAKRKERERRLAEVRKEVVQTIVGTDREFAAVVGTKTIRVGDRIHGFRVKAITTSGVVLEDNGD